MQETLYEKLIALQVSDEYPFHMPGHKRRMDASPFREMAGIDITEIEGFDNLHHAEGILKEEQDFAAALFGAKKTFFLVNGSTCGVLAAICGSAGQGESVILARNSHKSAYHAAYLQNLQPLFVYPSKEEKKTGIAGPVLAEDVAGLLDVSGAKAVFVTSPTYEGIVSDIAEIAREVHQRNAVLIVDEAHGAHLGFHDFFPESAIKCGADVVIQSLHKTLPSMTQTALLHICSDRAPVERISRYLSIFQTSSPSYPLMASISLCVHHLAEQREELFCPYVQKLRNFYALASGFTHISLFGKEKAESLFQAQFDPSKLVISVQHLIDENGKSYKGPQLAQELLDTFHIQVEMVSADYVIAMTSISDTQEGFDRLYHALSVIDARLRKNTAIRQTEDAQTGMQERDKGQDSFERSVKPKEVLRQSGASAGKGCSIRRALDGDFRTVLWEDCTGQISAEYVFVYPPGSPILVPGERITPQIRTEIEACREAGLHLQGSADYSLETIRVVS